MLPALPLLSAADVGEFDVLELIVGVTHGVSWTNWTERPVGAEWCTVTAGPDAHPPAPDEYHPPSLRRRPLNTARQRRRSPSGRGRYYTQTGPWRWGFEHGHDHIQHATDKHVHRSEPG